MKNILTLLSLLFILPFSFGQNIILEEDFEFVNNNIWVDGWVNEKHPDSWGWSPSNYNNVYINGPSGNSSGIMLASDILFFSDSSHQDYLMTPYMDFTGNSNITLEMTYTQPGSNGADGFIEISTDSGDTWVQVAQVPKANTEQLFRQDLTAYSSESNVRLRFHFNDNKLPGLFTGADFFAIDNLKIFEAKFNDVRPTKLDLKKYEKGGSRYILGSLKNEGLLPITSLNLNYSINGGPTVTSPATVNIAPGFTGNFIHLTLASFPAGGKQEIKFWTSNINGQSDENPANDTITQAVYTVSAAPTKSIFMTYLTGAWCGFCPDGTNRINNIIANNPDLNMNVAAVHSGDAMEFPNGDSIARALTSSYPSGVFDFYKFEEEDGLDVNRGVWLNRINRRKDLVSPVGASFADAGWDSTTRILSAIIRFEAFTDFNVDNRFNFWIIEDSVVGNGQGYDQADENGNYIVGYVHNRTLRHVQFGPWGVSNIVPNMVDGESWEITVSWTLPPQYDETKIKILTYIQEDNEDMFKWEVFNSAMMSLPLSPMQANNTSIDKDLGAKVLNIYPNPFTERLAVEYEIPSSGFTQIKVRDLFGREIRTLLSGTTPKGINTAYWNGRDEAGNKVPQGVYLISIETEGVVTYRRVVFEW